MTELFDTLLHLPEVFDRIAAANGNRREAGEQAHHGAHGHAHVHGLVGGGGGAPVDIVETPGEYTFLLDVPGFSKSDIQVRHHAQADSPGPVSSELVCSLISMRKYLTLVVGVFLWHRWRLRRTACW
jgi:hypothetical protein